MRLLSGGCSRVEYQRIRWLFAVVSCQYGALLGVPGTCGAVRKGFHLLAHCWVLRQQGPFSALARRGRGPVASGVPAPFGDHRPGEALFGSCPPVVCPGGDGVVV